MLFLEATAYFFKSSSFFHLYIFSLAFQYQAHLLPALPPTVPPPIFSPCPLLPSFFFTFTSLRKERKTPKLIKYMFYVLCVMKREK